MTDWPPKKAVEKLAGLMYAVDSGRRPWEVLPKHTQDQWREEARVILLALQPELGGEVGPCERCKGERSVPILDESVVPPLRFIDCPDCTQQEVEPEQIGGLSGEDRARLYDLLDRMDRLGDAARVGIGVTKNMIAEGRAALEPTGEDGEAAEAAEQAMFVVATETTRLDVRAGIQAAIKAAKDSTKGAK